MKTIRKARKDYHCDNCHGVIRKGNSYIHYQHRTPVEDSKGNQVSIEYLSYRVCNKNRCDGMLIYAFDYEKVLKNCNYGSHKFIDEEIPGTWYQEDGEMIATGKMICEYCGEYKN